MRARGVAGIALATIAMVAATAPAATAQTAPPETLIARLPATIDGVPVQVVASEDLQAWVDAAYAGESHPEIGALETALAGHGLSLADVPTVTAWFGEDQGGQLQGFRIPDGDAATFQEALTAAYLIGMGDLERTERPVGDHTATFLSEGPLETASYPFAVLPDSDVLWIVNAELGRIIDALEALLAVAAGTAPGNTGAAPPSPADLGPATWFGTMRQTLTWDKGAYVGETTAEFRGTWERIDDEGVGYCPIDPCVAYRPMGEVAWTFESAAPGPPACRTRQTGSVSTGDVVVPSDQMLFLAPANDGYVRYWGTGSVSVPEQECPGWEGIRAPGLFFEIPMAEGEEPFADVSGDRRPSCAAYDWRMEQDAPQLTGKCWRYDEPGYEQRFDWDLRRVDPE